MSSSKGAVDALRFSPNRFLLFERVAPVMSETMGVYVTVLLVCDLVSQTEKNPLQTSRY